MNNQTKFHITLIAKKNALEYMIKDANKHANDKTYTATQEFFREEEIKYRAKLDLINEIINEYLNS